MTSSLFSPTLNFNVKKKKKNHYRGPVSTFAAFKSHLIFRLHGAKCSLKACAMLWNIGMYND